MDNRAEKLKSVVLDPNRTYGERQAAFHLLAQITAKNVKSVKLDIYA